MPCFHPKAAWQKQLGGSLSFQYVKGWRAILVPCSTCHGCIKAQAAAWAFRCKREATRHLHTAFTTLTYDDTNLPITLSKRHLQLFFKRLRENARTMGNGMVPTTLRFFATGEYGEHTQRPHYHAIIFGLQGEMGSDGPRMVEKSWKLGITRTEPITPRRIAYCAGYTQKKLGDFKLQQEERIDPETGELYNWQPPFYQMSRGGRHGYGIGGYDRQFVDSWRLFAIDDGNKLAVPRYYHKAYRDQATEEELQQLQAEKDEYILSRDNSTPRLEAAEKIALAKHKLAGEKRRAI